MTDNTNQQPEKPEKMTFSVPAGFRARLEGFSEKSGLPLSRIVVRATNRYILQAEQQARMNQQKSGMGADL